MGSSAAETSPRYRPACDTCRSRKIKCNFTEAALSCEGCKVLGVKCTRIKPRRKRGPPNRHAPNRHEIVLQSSPDPQTQNPTIAHQDDVQPSSFDRGSEILAELGPMTLIAKVLDDWFSFLQPLVPVLHRRRLNYRLASGEANDNPIFLAVVLSTCAATVGTLGNKTSHDYGNITAARCLKMIDDNRLLQLGVYSLDWCIAQWNMAYSLSATGSRLPTRKLFRTLTNVSSGVQWLIGVETSSLSLCDKEVLKRLYGLLLTWQLGADTRGQSYFVFHPFHVDLEPLRPRDITDWELDVESGFSDLAQPPLDHEARYMPGFNASIDIITIWQSARVEAIHKPKAEVLQKGFERVRNILDNLPPKLRWRGGLSRPPGTTWSHEAQSFNLHINALYIQSSLLQLYGTGDSDYSQKTIMSDLLEILNHVPQSILEVNSQAQVVRMRDIGAAYMEELQIHATLEPSASPELSLLLGRLATLDAGNAT